MNILVVGDWQNAIVTWACLGHLGHFAILAPRNGTPEGTIPKLEIPEPGLDDMIQAGQQGPYLAVEIEGEVKVWVVPSVTAPEGDATGGPAAT